MNLKPVRRQAHRYGKQVAELHNADLADEAAKIFQAFLTFMTQFEDDDDTVIRDWLLSEFILGKSHRERLSGFVPDHHGILTKTYSLTK